MFVSNHFRLFLIPPGPSFPRKRGFGDRFSGLPPARAGEKAEHTREYVSILSRPVTRTSGIRGGFETTSIGMTMTLMTGDRLAKEILNIRSDMPIIHCTGFSEKISEEKAREFGIKAFEMKPLTKRDLSITVRKVLDEEKG